ncbi:sensor histidine kinase [bacterium]|nr:sensor histidine kinase [bacterium]
MRPGFTFGTKFVSLVLLSCVLPTCVMGLVAYRSQRVQGVNSTSNLVVSLADSSSHQIERWLDEQRSTGEAIARSPDLLQDWQDRNRFAKDSDDYFLALFRLYRVLRLCDESSRWVTEVRLADRDGKVFLSDNSEATQGEVAPEGAQLDLASVLAGGRSVFSKVFLAVVPGPQHMNSVEFSVGFPTMWLLSPVKGEGEAVGVVACRIAVGDSGRLFPTEAKSVPVDVFLIRKDGLVISSNRKIHPQSFRQTLPPDENGNAFPQPSVSMVAYQDYSGRPVYGAWDPVPGTDMVVLVQISQGYLDSRTARDSLIGISLGLTLVFFTVAFLMAERLLKPLKRLTRAAQALAEGNRNVRVNLCRGDEIGALGDTFDRMAGALEATLLDLETARDEALEAYRAKGRFLANMTHELRTPLNAIIGYSEMLITEVGEAGQQQWVEDLQVVRRSGKDLLAMINGILDLSKLEAGKLNVDATPFSLGELCQEVSLAVVPLLREKDNEFFCSFERADVVSLDQMKVKQVLLNLLSNAAKFTEKGQIELGAEVSGDTVRLWVKDTGIGMTEEQSKRVFEEFAQADDSTTRKYGGTGLGLTIVRRFVELMGGTMEVASQVGVGTTFTVHLPREYAA